MQRKEVAGWLWSCDIEVVDDDVDVPESGAGSDIAIASSNSRSRLRRRYVSARYKEEEKYVDNRCQQIAFWTCRPFGVSIFDSSLLFQYNIQKWKAGIHASNLLKMNIY